MLALIITHIRQKVHLVILNIGSSYLRTTVANLLSLVKVDKVAKLAVDLTSSPAEDKSKVTSVDKNKIRASDMVAELKLIPYTSSSSS
jgi:hypothetical protein